MSARKRKSAPAASTPKYRVNVSIDEYWIEDGSDGKPLPETEEHYADNPITPDDRPTLSYEDYLTTYGDPDNYTGYNVDLEQQCACCGEWKRIDSVCTSLYDEYETGGIYELDDPKLNAYFRELVKGMIP